MAITHFDQEEQREIREIVGGTPIEEMPEVESFTDSDLVPFIKVTGDNASPVKSAAVIKATSIGGGSGGGEVTGVKGDSESDYRKGNVNITKANIGLGNVDNKSSATLKGEIMTGANVKTALGTVDTSQSQGKFLKDDGTWEVPQGGGNTTDVNYDTTNKKITKTIDGTTSDVVTVATLKTDMNLAKSDVGLGNVGNFKAVSTEASQGLTDTEKGNARTNIGAGTSNFSGSYNDLTNKPTIPTVPTNVSAFTNDAGYLTQHQDISGKADKIDTYTKTEVDNLISSAPESDVIVIEVPSGSDIATYLLNNVPAAQRPNNIFRVPGTNSFSEWGWDGTAFVMLDEKNYSVDDIPTKDSQGLASSGGIYNAIMNNKWDSFYCINASSDVCFCDGTYSVKKDDILSKDPIESSMKVVNSTKKETVMSDTYHIDETDLKRQPLYTEEENRFKNAISGIYTITESTATGSDNDFVGFPETLSHNGVLYIFYRRSKYHDLTPNKSTLNIQYKFSADGGGTWSDEYSILFPDTPNNTSDSAPSAWDNIHIDWRHYYYKSYGGYIYGCSWACVFYGDGVISNGDRRNYPSVLVRISQNADKTLTLDKMQWFPEVVLQTKTVTFDSTRMDYYNRPTPNYSDYKGCIGGGGVVIKDGVMYIPMYFSNCTGTVSWEINENLTVNSSNFAFLGSLTTSDYDISTVYCTESTLWFDDSGNIKTLVRFDPQIGGESTYSKIYRVDTTSQTYVELATCSKCHGPFSTRIDNNRSVIFGRGDSAKSNVILWDNDKNAVISENNQFDTMGGLINGWSDSFYGGITSFRGMYYAAFYKRLSATLITIDYFTANRLDINSLYNYNSKENDNDIKIEDMGTLIRNKDIVIGGDYQYFMPCSAIVSNKNYYTYNPSFDNNNSINLSGTIVFGTGFFAFKDFRAEAYNEHITISAKDSTNDICILYQYRRYLPDQQVTTVNNVDIDITYKHGEYYCKFHRTIADIMSSPTWTLTSLYPTLIANTQSDKCAASNCNLNEANFGHYAFSDKWEIHNASETDTHNVRFDASQYNDGVSIRSNYDARLMKTGITVNGVPVLSMPQIPDEKAIDLVSGKYLFASGVVQAPVYREGYGNLQIDKYNDWIQTQIASVTQ